MTVVKKGNYFRRTSLLVNLDRSWRILLTLANRWLPMEDFLALAVAFAFFLLSLRIMSGNGLLPGNDPGVHLKHVYAIIESGRILLPEFSLTLPLFHIFVAELLSLTGAIDVLAATFLLKIFISSINALSALAVYLFCRGPFGKAAALLSSIFLVLSIPLMELTAWGGYTNIIALLYITFLFYLLSNEYKTPIKFFLLLLMALTLFMVHFLSAFVFFLMVVPVFLIQVRRSRKRIRDILGPLAALLGFILAVGIWYLRIFTPYLSVTIYHLLFEMKAYLYTIPFVSLDIYLKNFGVALFLAALGIPAALFSLRHRKRLDVFVYLSIWIIVPVLLSQAYLFGVYLLYPRFIYYLATPVAIFSGMAVHCISKVPGLAASKLSSFKIGRLIKMSWLVSAFSLIILFVPLASQFMLAFPQIGGMPSYYDVCSLSGYRAGLWLRRYSDPNVVVVASEKPGSWVRVIAQRPVLEEIDPVFGRSFAADTVLSLCYEVENHHTLVRKYTPSGYVSGLDVHVLVNNLYQRILRLPDDGVYVSYKNITGVENTIHLSDRAEQKVYWAEMSSSEARLVLEDSFKPFTLQRIVTIRKDSLPVELEWLLIAHEKLSDAELRMDSSINPFFQFNEAIIPGVLDWGNPWDEPSTVDESGGWAVVECPPNKLTEDYVAVLDSEKGLLGVFKFATIPDWLNIGALANRLIDAVRVGYRLGNVEAGETYKVHFSVLTYSLGSKPYELSEAAITRLLRSKVEMHILTRDYLTYLHKYNIRFIVGDPRWLSPDFAVSPLFNKVYDNGKLVIYAVNEGLTDSTGRS